MGHYQTDDFDDEVVSEEEEEASDSQSALNRTTKW